MAGIQARSTGGRLEDNVNSSKDLRKEHYLTGQHIGSGRRALDTIPMGVYLVADDIVEAGSDNNLVNLTAHGAKKGDVLRINTSANSIEEFEVSIDEIVSANSLRLGAVLSASLEVGDTVSILRPITQRMSSSGATLAQITASPVVFMLDGVETEVTEDTVTPGNNAPLPVKLTGVTGDINITAGDLNVQLSDAGPSADKTRIGDGTNELAITAAGEATVSDADGLAALLEIVTQVTGIESNTDGLETSFATLNGKDFATSAKQDTQIASLAALEAVDFATQTTLAALLAEMQTHATLAETQPVSAASLPLPTGAATSSKQDDQITHLASIAGEDFATQTTLALMKTALDSLLTGEGAVADAAVSNPASSGSMIALLKGILTLLTTVNTKLDTIDNNTSPAMDSVTNITATVNTLSNPPAGAKGMIVQCSLDSTSAIRFCGSGVTPSSSVGFYLGVGQSTSYMPAAAVRTISHDGGAVDASILWFV